MNNLARLAIAANQQAHDIRQARAEINNAKHSNAFRRSVVNYWEPKLVKAANSIIRRANNHGIRSNRHGPHTAAYYNTLVNLIHAKMRSPSRAR
jgi:hypothetical protein